MAKTSQTPDITIRGGLINVPASAKPQKAPRHQPNTPINKKDVTPRPDHQPTTAQPAEPPPAATTEPESDKPNVPTETSESD